MDLLENDDVTVWVNSRTTENESDITEQTDLGIFCKNCAHR